jgi:hypothetical protein
MSAFWNVLLRKTFKNKQGRWAIGAVPNLPLIVWAVSVPLGWVLSGIPGKIISMVGYGALFTWAWLELFQGVNYFRRALGAIVLLYVVWSGVYHA